MHIPDGYLSPQTYAPLFGVFFSFVAVAIKKIKNKIEKRMVPFLGMASAFAFLIMMFNIPIPGGTTGHAVGSAIVSLLFGPWIAFVAVSVAIILQAFVFGDGGITAIGANCINMALIMPFVAWYSFRLISGKTASKNKLNITSFISGYLSLNICALITSIEIGLQPLIAIGADGYPLYSPYPLKVTIPAMLLENMFIFGIVEGLLTLLIFKYFYSTKQEMIQVLKY